MNELEAPLLKKLEGLEEEERQADALVEKAREEAARIVGKAEDVRKGVASERRRIDRALRVLRGEPLSQPKVVKKRNDGWVPSQRCMDNIREAARRVAAKNGDHGFFFHQLQEESPHAVETTRRGLDQLRVLHEVRRAGKRDAGPHRGKMDYFFLDLIAEEAPKKREKVAA